MSPGPDASRTGDHAAFGPCVICRREKGTHMCKITATNWNGTAIVLEARTSLDDMEKLTHVAHRAIRRAGFTTYRLDTVNGTRVPYRLQYAA